MYIYMAMAIGDLLKTHLNYPQFIHPNTIDLRNKNTYDYHTSNTLQNTMTQQQTIKNIATKLRQSGWNVMPLKHNSKSPSLPEWKQLIDRKMTNNEFTQAFSPTYNHGNLALITGKTSNITVIDIDAKRSDKQPIIDPEKLLDRLPKTLTSKTGGGGYHLFYQYAPIINSTRHIHPQVDIKSHGGYVVLPPSIHNVTKKPYEWHNNLPIAPFPQKILSIDQAKRENPTLIQRDWSRIISGVAMGSRNNDLARLTGKLLHTFGWNSEDLKRDAKIIYELIHAWNSRCEPPLPEDEVNRTFNSIFNKYYAGRK
jgi:hypothetical protein